MIILVLHLPGLVLVIIITSSLNTDLLLFHSGLFRSIELVGRWRLLPLPPYLLPQVIFKSLYSVDFSPEFS